MKFVVKECLNAGCRASSAGAASLDGILFNKLLFDFSRKRFGEDSRRTGLPEAVPHVRSGATSVIYHVKSQHSLPIALVNSSERGVCHARPGSTPKRCDAAANGLLIPGAERSVFRPVPAFNAA
jgi:hypothetical protein